MLRGGSHMTSAKIGGWQTPLSSLIRKSQHLEEEEEKKKKKTSVADVICEQSLMFGSKKMDLMQEL